MNEAQYKAIRRAVGSRVGFNNRDLEDYVQEAAIAHIQGRDWDWGIIDHQRKTYRWVGYARTRERITKPISGDAPLKRHGTQSDPITWFDVIADERVDIEEHATRIRLHEILERLTPRQRVIALMLANDIPGCDVAERLGVSESRISQILADIRRRLDDDVPQKPPAPPWRDRHAIVVELMDEGVAAGEIARRVGITTKAVHGHIDRERARRNSKRESNVREIARKRVSEGATYREIADEIAGVAA